MIAYNIWTQCPSLAVVHKIVIWLSAGCTPSSPNICSCTLSERMCIEFTSLWAQFRFTNIIYSYKRNRKLTSLHFPSFLITLTHLFNQQEKQMSLLMNILGNKKWLSIGWQQRRNFNFWRKLVHFTYTTNTVFSHLLSSSNMRNMFMVLENILIKHFQILIEQPRGKLSSWCSFDSSWNHSISHMPNDNFKILFYLFIDN